jgi:hypothetical protein
MAPRAIEPIVYTFFLGGHRACGKYVVSGGVLDNEGRAGFSEGFEDGEDATEGGGGDMDGRGGDQG